MNTIYNFIDTILTVRRTVLIWCLFLSAIGIDISFKFTE